MNINNNSLKNIKHSVTKVRLFHSVSVFTISHTTIRSSLCEYGNERCIFVLFCSHQKNKICLHRSVAWFLGDVCMRFRSHLNAHMPMCVTYHKTQTSEYIYIYSLERISGALIKVVFCSANVCRCIFYKNFVGSLFSPLHIACIQFNADK